MTEADIIANYKTLPTSKLVSLSKNILTIQIQFREHLLNELRERNELLEVENAIAQIKEFKEVPAVERKKRTLLEKLPFFLMLFPFGVLLDHFFHASAFSKETAPENDHLKIDVLFLILYSIPVVLAFKKKYLILWISFTLYLLTTLVFFFILFTSNDIKADAWFELVIRLCLILSFLGVSIEAYNYFLSKKTITTDSSSQKKCTKL